jgi:hypothetical protein
MHKELREQLLAPYFDSESMGGVRYFHELPLSVLDELIAHNFIERGEWNDCPGVDAAFLPFMRRNPEFTAHGYAVDWDRKDVRITVEGVEKSAPISKREMIDFIQTFNGADEVELAENHARCWYD